MMVTALEQVYEGRNNPVISDEDLRKAGLAIDATGFLVVAPPDGGSYVEGTVSPAGAWRLIRKNTATSNPPIVHRDREWIRDRSSSKQNVSHTVPFVGYSAPKGETIGLFLVMVESAEDSRNCDIARSEPTWFTKLPDANLFKTT